MPTPFNHWSPRITAAEELSTRKALLTEIAYWRATRLGDIPAQRDASYGLARLHSVLGDPASAIREAQALVSLCQSPPEAAGEDLRFAVGFLQTLGGSSVVHRVARETAPGRAPREPRAPRAEPSERPAKRPEAGASAVDDAIFAGGAGRYDLALSALRGVSGPEADLVRTWVYLARGLASDDPQRELSELERRLRNHLAARERDPKGPKEDRKLDAREVGRAVPARASGAAEQALAGWLGHAVPAERQMRIDLLESAASDTARLDGLAARALLHHVEVEGAKAPAPWLIGLTARALAAGDASETRNVIVQLGTAYAVTAYSEPQFMSVVFMLSAALSSGFDYLALRRGVLARGEPSDRKLWTLRLACHGFDRQIVVAPPSVEPYRPETAQRLAHRIAELCGRTVLVAAGGGNEGLRDAFSAMGGSAMEEEVPGAVLSALAHAEDLNPTKGSGPTGDTASEDRPVRRERDSAEVAALFAAELPPVMDEVLPAMQAMPRVYRAFPAIRDAIAAMSVEEQDTRWALALEAADRAAPAGVRLSEGASVAIEMLRRRGRSSEAYSYLCGFGASRYAGPGFETVAILAAAAVDAGWSLNRVLRGTTVKERRDDPVLDALGHAADGLWRALLDRAGGTVELWFMADLAPEGRAAIPRILLTPGRRIIVVPVDGDLLSWYAGLRGPEAIGWTGDEVADVLSGLGRV